MYVNAMSPMKEGGCREYVPSRDRNGIETRRSCHGNFYEAAYTSLWATFVRNQWEESSGEGREAGMGRRKNRKSSKSKIVCIYRMVIIALSSINSLARAGGDMEEPAGGISRANQVVCVSESE